MDVLQKGGNGRDANGLGTQERRFFAGALTGVKLIWSLVITVISGTAVVLGAYYHASGRIDAAEVRLQQHDAAIESKQSKEAADGDRREILQQLKSINDNIAEIKADMKQSRERTESRSRR